MQFQFLLLFSLFQTCFIVIVLFSFIVKHPNKSFFNVIHIFGHTSFTTLFTLYIINIHIFDLNVNFFLKTGTDVCYYQNHIKRKGGHYYTASFTITFPHDNDTVHLAYCYPYTYSDLQLYLKELEDDPKRRNRFRRRTMCQTLAGKYKKRKEERASRIWM